MVAQDFFYNLKNLHLLSSSAVSGSLSRFFLVLCRKIANFQYLLFQFSASPHGTWYHHTNHGYGVIYMAYHRTYMAIILLCMVYHRTLWLIIRTYCAYHVTYLVSSCLPRYIIVHKWHIMRAYIILHMMIVIFHIAVIIFYIMLRLSS